jgi:hypothetical protein
MPAARTSLGVGLLAALVLCTSCGSGSSSTGASPTASASRSTYPTSIVALGHSGLTGFDSNPSLPEKDAPENSWATGTNPQVRSVYQRLVALNPAAEGHVANFAMDGTGVDALPAQEAYAADVTPAPDLVLVQSIDNDMRCDGTDRRNFGPYRRKLTAFMDTLTSDLPDATVFFVDQPADVKEYDRVAKTIDPSHLTGDGPCFTIDQKTGRLDPKREAYLQGLVNAYFGIIKDVCSHYPTCRTDEGAAQAMHLEKQDLTHDLNHLSVTGHAKMAALMFQALYG